MKKKIALIGSTGSIGRQTLQAVRNNPEWEVCALTAHCNARLLAEQIREFSPSVACLSGLDRADELDGLKVLYGEQSILSAVTEDADLVFVAVTGFAGLKVVLKALSMGKRVALANKEALVCGGELVLKQAALSGGEIIPVDSEHSALWQALGFNKTGFRRLILTASGGPFLTASLEDMQNFTALDALRHPNWKMGDKITIDCATMLNKGFEVIEAHYLFNAPLDRIGVVVHPQSIIHSMVEFEDNSVIAEMSYPDMLQPIQLALTYPKRLNAGLSPIDFAKLGKLEFFPLDRQKFPCFDLAVSTLKVGGTLPCSMNGASEVAVKAFLNGEIAFTDIYKVIEKVVSISTVKDVDIATLTEADSLARENAKRIIKENFSKR